MKLERSDIEFPLWRKKVDATLIKDGATPIPKWLWKVWDIEELFLTSISKSSSTADVKIVWGREKFTGKVVLSSSKKMCRLFFDRSLSDILKDTFLMSYMRSIENDLRKNKLEYLSNSP